MAFKNATKAYLNGVTVATADIEDSAVTTAKIASETILAGDISQGEAPFLIGPQYLATVAATTALIDLQMYGRVKVLEVGASLVANGTAGSTVLDLHTGASKAAATTVLAAAKLKIKAATTIGVATPVTAAVADNGYLRVDVDGVASGTKSGLKAWVWAQRY